MAVIGVLTAGGDCPGLNAVIRGVTARALHRGDSEVVGILHGWEGLMDGDTRPLERASVRGILGRGGTILGTSRKDPYVHGDGYESVKRTMLANGLDVVALAFDLGGIPCRRPASETDEVVPSGGVWCHRVSSGVGEFEASGCREGRFCLVV